MSVSPGRFCLILALAALTGCTTTAPLGGPAPAPAPMADSVPATAPTRAPTAAAVTLPAPPPPSVVVPLPPASITGSEETSTMLDNFTVYVVAVDGVAVAGGRPGWSTPIALPAGPHRVSLGFNRGVFAAHADLAIEAVSAAAYEVRFASDAQLFGQNSYCEFWIVDTATGQPVTPRVRSALSRIEPPR
ncbi:hypothetical protein Verru16b_02290 [Lacunisphaera limnophila]|uniref:PEGA domain protein n=1 Tax=Lacunisphaera limnophila TaxID=1838286 RepID=A0A1D8AWE2_9BACT|nr:hypothetical protein [Lacunisphaera limnophila]AOS45212.1 hypothetical protein Verru16b_02290 [Lacunisphaera limnophila]